MSILEELTHYSFVDYVLSELIIFFDTDHIPSSSYSSKDVVQINETIFEDISENASPIEDIKAHLTTSDTILGHRIDLIIGKIPDSVPTPRQVKHNFFLFFNFSH